MHYTICTYDGFADIDKDQGETILRLLGNKVTEALLHYLHIIIYTFCKSAPASSLFVTATTTTTTAATASAATATATDAAVAIIS